MVNKNQIIAMLKTDGVYQDEYDYLLDELLYNFKILKEAKKELKEKGLITIGFGNRPARNPAHQVYQETLKNIMTLSRKIGLSPFDRKQILSAAQTNDDLSDIIDG